MDTLSGEHQLILWIKNESSTTKKKEALTYYKDSVKLMNIFNYLLNPFKKFFIKIIPGNVVGEGENVINQTTWDILDLLVERKLTGKAAKVKLFTHIATLTPSEGKLLKQIVQGTLKIGVAIETANSVWPGLIPTKMVQKAEDYDSKYAHFPMLAGLKLDGIRAEYKDGLFTTRSGHTIEGLCHIKDSVVNGHWDGELVIPELDFDTASGIIRSKAISKPMVRYVVFDNLSIPTVNNRLRIDTLSGRFKRYDYHKGASNPAATYLHHDTFIHEDHLMAEFAKVVGTGHEGLVVKVPHGVYRNGRNYNWMKLKKGFEGEFLIVDVYEGKGKYIGMLGGIIIQMEPFGKARVGSGFSDEARVRMWEDQSFIGRQATIVAMERTANGSLRHPVYKVVRWDL